MYHYAQLNNDYYCISFSTFNTDVDSEYLVPVTNYDKQYKNRKYDINNQVWLDEYLDVPPVIPHPPEQTLEERIKVLELQLEALRNITIELSK